MARSLRIALRLLMALTAIQAVVYAQVPEGVPSGEGLDEGIATLEIIQISRRDEVGYYAGDTLFLRFTGIAEFLGIIHAVSADGDTLSGEMPTGSPFAFVASSGTFHRYGAIDTLPHGTIRSREGEPIIAFDELNRALGLGGSFDYDRLRVLLPPDPKIPTVDLRQAMKRYARLGGGDAEAPEQEIVHLRRSLFGALGIDWSLLNSTTDETQNTYGNVGVSTPFLYGVLQLRGRAGMTGSTASNVDLGFEGASWRLDLPEFPLLNTVTLGYRPSLGSPTYSVGLSGTTIVGRPNDYGVREISGTAEPGWWAELYEGSRLVEVVRVDEEGEYRFDVPMTSTMLRRKIVLRGPHGERLTDDRTLALGGDMMPAGDFRWNLGGTTFDHLGNQAVSGSAGLKIGVHDRLTLDIATALPGMLAERVRPDSLRTSIGIRMALFDATPISLSVDPQNLRFGTSFTLDPFDVMPLLVRLDSVDVRNGTFGASASTRLVAGPVTAGAVGRYVNRWDRRGFEFNPTVTLRFLGASLGTGLRASRLERLFASGESEEQLRVDRALSLRTQLSFSPLDGVRMRFGTSYDFISRQIAESNAGVSFPLLGMFTASLQYSMPGTDWRDGAFAANLSVRLPFARGSVSSRYDDGRVATQSRLAGAFVVSSAGLDNVREQVGSRAQMLTVAFHDRNLNGVYDGDDVTLGEVDMEIMMKNGGNVASGGMFEALPVKHTFIAQVNVEQYAHRGLYPLRASTELALPSGVTEVLYVPFASGADLFGSGTIRLANGGHGNLAALFGLRVHLVSIDGVAEYESEFINDGSFLVSGVAPGTYRVVVDNDALMAMGLTLEPMSEVVIEPGTETIPELVFVPLANFSTPSEADE